MPGSKKATETLDYLAQRGEREFLPDTPHAKHHIQDVRYNLSRGIFIGAGIVFVVEFILTWGKMPANSSSLDALHDAFTSFDSLNAGIFTVLGTVIGFYFGKSTDSA